MTTERVRDFLTACAAASIMAAAIIAAPANAQELDANALARSLAEPMPPECETKLPDGTCPDTVDTRQLLMQGGARKASGAAGRATRAAATAVRQNISMTFESGSAQLTANARAALDRLARALVSVGNYRPFEIEGHTDRVGSRELNQALSKARAESVVTYLAEKGVDRNKMTPRGFGYDRPLAGVSPNDPRNRRVEASAR